MLYLEAEVNIILANTNKTIESRKKFGQIRCKQRHVSDYLHATFKLVTQATPIKCVCRCNLQPALI
jgi:hypothetical protein